LYKDNQHRIGRAALTDVLVVGLAVADFLFQLPQMPDRAEKYVADDAAMVGGGGAANAAVAITRLGATARLGARVGDDLIGNYIVSNLEAAGVDCTLVHQSEKGVSAFSSVLVDSSGERQIVNFRGRNLSDNTQALHQITVDAVLADTRWEAGTVAALRRARELGVPAVLDAEAPVSRRTIEHASHVAFSRQGLTDFTGITDLPTALQSVSADYPVWMCVTDGAQGVLYTHRGEIVHEPVVDVDVVDTLGAGDVWHGAFTCCLAQGLNEVDALRFANAAATLKCTRAGGGRSSPSQLQVENFMATGKVPGV